MSGSVDKSSKHKKVLFEEDREDISDAYDACITCPTREDGENRFVTINNFFMPFAA